uniref:Uncharacterized protein n=1 Tax=Leersia perrieri TaxID=77586 RepID=A0A0D9WPT7_9ORYZ
MSYQSEWACSSPPNCTYGKAASWPELVGKKGGETMAVIQRERPDVTGAIIVPQDAVITDDYCCNRVRVFVDCSGSDDCSNATVVSVPKIG